MAGDSLSHRRQDVITCAELETALARLKETSGEAKVRSLVSVLDADHDGNINIREVAEVSHWHAHYTHSLGVCLSV